MLVFCYFLARVLFCSIDEIDMSFTLGRIFMFEFNLETERIGDANTIDHYGRRRSRSDGFIRGQRILLRSNRSIEINLARVVKDSISSFECYSYKLSSVFHFSAKKEMICDIILMFVCVFFFLTWRKELLARGINIERA